MMNINLYLFYKFLDDPKLKEEDILFKVK